ncbi:MAG: Crp/Fnr family transcriptional regulator [Candidatus Solibacter sp.]
MPLPADQELVTMRRETFARTPLFSALLPEEREQLGALASPHHFDAGVTLFYEGEECLGLWVIASGTVKITKTSSAGREIMLAVENAPSSVAEVPLFDGGGYPANVSAIRDTLAFLLHKDDFRRFCVLHPQVPLKVLAVVGKRLRVLVQLVETVTFGSVRQRLARVLLQAAENSPAGEPPEIPITHEELAARLGTVREVVTRNLSRFQAEGLLKVAKRHILIADAEALREEAETEF